MLSWPELSSASLSHQYSQNWANLGKENIDQTRVKESNCSDDIAKGFEESEATLCGSDGAGTGGTVWLAEDASSQHCKQQDNWFDATIRPRLSCRPLRLSEWTAEQVNKWLDCTPLPLEVTTILKDNVINGPVLESITEDDLRSLGIDKFGYRRQVLLSRKELQELLSSKLRPPEWTECFEMASPRPSTAGRETSRSSSPRASKVVGAEARTLSRDDGRRQCASTTGKAFNTVVIPPQIDATKSCSQSARCRSPMAERGGHSSSPFFGAPPPAVFRNTSRIRIHSPCNSWTPMSAAVPKASSTISLTSSQAASQFQMGAASVSVPCIGRTATPLGLEGIRTESCKISRALPLAASCPSHQPTIGRAAHSVPVPFFCSCSCGRTASVSSMTQPTSARLPQPFVVATPIAAAIGTSRVIIRAPLVSKATYTSSTSKLQWTAPSTTSLQPSEISSPRKAAARP